MNRQSLVTMVALVFSFVAFSFAGTGQGNVKTIQNLKDAFKGETTASAKYAAYSKKAKDEGYEKIALLFQAASKSESIHAANHSAAIEQIGGKMDPVTPEFEVKSTKENLQDAIAGESYEVETMYPDFLKAASIENANIALLSFNYAYQTEKKHKVLYANALKELTAGNEGTLPDQYMVCSTCGNTYEGDAPQRCGISMTPKERFYTIK
ncbi:MAG: rubrerythrin family protein [Calditrichaceae bacterium]